MNSDYYTDYLCYIHRTVVMVTSFILFKLAIQNPNVCYSFFIMGSPTCNGIKCIMHIVLSYLFYKTISNCFLTLSVLVIAKITVVFQCVNELHVNVQNDINHSWTLWLFLLTCNIFFILSDHHTLHTFYNLPVILIYSLPKACISGHKMLDLHVYV